MGRTPRRFGSGPGRRAGAFTLLELLIVIGIIVVVAGLSVATLGGFLKGSTCKHGGRILQGQFFKARQLAASKRMYHFLRIETTAQLLSSVRIFEDTNLNRTFNPPDKALTGEAVGADQVVGEIVSLPRGAFVGAPLNDPINAAPNQLISLSGLGGQGAPPTNQVLDFQFRPDGTCVRIPAGDLAFNIGAGTTYNQIPGAQADIVILQEDGRARMLIDINPMGGKIQKMIFQVANPTGQPYQ